MVALGLGGLLAVARDAQGPLDDADPAYQRPGILDIGQLPDPAAMVTPGIPAPGRTAVVFFVRPAQLGGLCDALSLTDLQRDPDLVVVVAGSAAPCGSAERVVADPGGRLAATYGMREPRKGGPPVGYAVVDRTGQIRYRTLDPEVINLLGEVDTILGAL